MVIWRNIVAPIAETFPNVLTFLLIYFPCKLSPNKYQARHWRCGLPGFILRELPERWHDEMFHVFRRQQSWDGDTSLDGKETNRVLFRTKINLPPGCRFFRSSYILLSVKNHRFLLVGKTMPGFKSRPFYFDPNCCSRCNDVVERYLINLSLIFAIKIFGIRG